MTITPVVTEHLIPNNDGWLLQARQVHRPKILKKNLRPVIILPGYGMNSHVFGFHPAGDSMEALFTEAGYEVWSVNLRWQGTSRPISRKPIPPSLRDLVETDLPAVIHHALRHTLTSATQVSLIGCSLGGTLAYGYMATSSEDLVGAVITIGSPLRWTQAPALLRLVTKIPRLVRYVPTGGTHALAKFGFPILVRVPQTLSFYINPKNVDLSATNELVKTISDPHPNLNMDLARWIQRKDLVIRDVDVNTALQHVTKPLLVIWTPKDTIVPAAAATHALKVWGDGQNVTKLELNHPQRWYGHADMFFGHRVKEDVFTPAIRWLDEHA